MPVVIGLAIATAINILAMAIIIPILPFHILALGGNAWQATVIYSVFSATSVMTVFFWGRLSDRYGRKTILMLSIGVTSLSYLWLAFASHLWEIYAARALAGAFAAWLPVSQAFIGDVVPKERRAAAMGALGAAFGAGFTIGPALGGYMAHFAFDPNFVGYNYALPYTVSAILAAICLLFTLLSIRDSAQRQITPMLSSIRHILNHPMVLPLIALYFGVSLIFTGVEGVLTVWSQATLSWQPQDIGIALMIAGMASIVTQGYLIRLASRHLGDANTIILGTSFLALGLLGLSLNDYSLTTIILLMVLALGLGLTNPANQSLLSQVAPEGLRGGVMGVAQASASFARVLGPIWSGLLFAHYGGNTPFYAGTIMAVILVISAYVIVRPHRKNLTA